MAGGGRHNRTPRSSAHHAPSPLASTGDKAAHPWAPQGSCRLDVAVSVGDRHPRRLLLFAEDLVSGLKADNLRTGFEAIAELLSDLVPHDVLREAITKLGAPNRSIGVRDMATRIDSKLRTDGTSKLYNLVYPPTSNYFAHANAGPLAVIFGRATKVE